PGPSHTRPPRSDRRLIRATIGRQSRAESTHDVVYHGVKSDERSSRVDALHGEIQLTVWDARETHRVRLEGRHLETAGAGAHELFDLVEAAGLGDGRPQRHIG